jgi:pimeloyl-ACP methyl ester carboxylesterase
MRRSDFLRLTTLLGVSLPRVETLAAFNIRERRGLSTRHSMNIKPFKIAIPAKVLEDLHDRIKNTRWPDEIVGADWSRGMPLGYAKKLSEYWHTKFDWRKQESRINRYPQFIVEIDRQPIHFLHVRSSNPKALPLLLCHCYPGSFVDFLHMIEPLVNPVASGSGTEQTFHLVIPSHPGFGFSTPVVGKGWEISKMANAYLQIMEELGYAHYGVHGGDIGAGICEQLCIQGGERIIGTLITTDPGAIATDYTPPTDHLNEVEKKHLEELKSARREDFGYIQIQSTRPQTLAYSLTDSPVGQMAWIVEKFKEWTDPIKEMPEDAVDIEQLLINVSIYWFGRGGAGAANFIYEAAHAALSWGQTHNRPQGFVVFGKEPLVRRILDPEQKIAYWNEHERGGHFAAMESPEALVGDIRSFFRKVK